MGGEIPAGAVGASVGVLAYSVICLTLCTMVVGLLFSYGEKWTYVAMLAIFSAISTPMSIVQQIHYAISWRAVKIAQFEKAAESQRTGEATLQGAAGIIDIVLFNIQFYCYNVMVLTILWWAVKLFCGAWGLRGSFPSAYVNKAAPASKIFAIVWPALIIGISFIPAISNNNVLSIILNTITMFISLSTGSVLLVLILHRYMKTRRLVAGSHYANGGGWWAPSSRDPILHSQALESGTGRSQNISEKRRSIYDRTLVIRFTIGFTILAVFEVAIIIFLIFKSRSFASIVAKGAPNFEVGSAISDILFFIPGVTTSLVVYLVFGTTKSCKQYFELVLSCCGLRQRVQHKRQAAPGAPRALEFDRLESMSDNHSMPGTILQGDTDGDLASRSRYYST